MSKEDKPFLQISSDLHIEYNNDSVPNVEDYIIPTAKNLVLAGDIGTFYKYEQLYGFILNLSKLFENVIYVLGNHEYYKSKNTEKLINMFEIKKLALKMKDTIKNLHILDNDVIVLKYNGVDYKIIGSTLWSNPTSALTRGLRNIYGINLERFKQKYKDSVSFLEREIKKCAGNNQKAIVITHYVPSISIVPFNKINENISLYASDLEYLFCENIIYWIFGHIHHNFNITMYGTKLITNQKGKPRDNIKDFSLSCVLNV